MSEIKQTALIKVQTINRKLFDQIPERHEPSSEHVVPLGIVASEGYFRTQWVLFRNPGNQRLERIEEKEWRHHLLLSKQATLEQAFAKVDALPQIFLS
jgi:hypothetical protein